MLKNLWFRKKKKKKTLSRFAMAVLKQATLYSMRPALACQLSWKKCCQLQLTSTGFFSHWPTTVLPVLSAVSWSLPCVHALVLCSTCFMSATRAWNLFNWRRYSSRLLFYEITHVKIFLFLSKFLGCINKN